MSWNSDLLNIFFSIFRGRYVIKAVVYEIGILTEVNENSTEEESDDDNYS